MLYPELDKLSQLLDSVTEEEMAKVAELHDLVKEGETVIGMAPEEARRFHTLADRLEKELGHANVDYHAAIPDSPEAEALLNQAYIAKRLRSLCVSFQWLSLRRVFSNDRIRIAKGWVIVDAGEETVEDGILSAIIRRML